jgi:hypothetical protein
MRRDRELHQPWGHGSRLMAEDEMRQGKIRWRGGNASMTEVTTSRVNPIAAVDRL